METHRIPAGTGIGRVHLKVSDIDRALAVYTEVLGFDRIMADPLDLDAVLRDAPE